MNLTENCDKIKIRDDVEIKVDEDNLKIDVYYFSQKYKNINAKITENNRKKLENILQLEEIDQDNVNKQLNELKNALIIVSKD